MVSKIALRKLRDCVNLRNSRNLRYLRRFTQSRNLRNTILKTIMEQLFALFWGASPPDPPFTHCDRWNYSIIISKLWLRELRELQKFAQFTQLAKVARIARVAQAACIPLWYPKSRCASRAIAEICATRAICANCGNCGDLRIRATCATQFWKQ